MTEHQNEQPVENEPVPSELVPSAPAVESGLPVESGPPGELSAPPPAKKPLLRGRIAAVTGSLVVAGALVTGVGYTAVTVNDADRAAGAPVWTFPKTTTAGDDKAATAKGLAGLLVPYGTTGSWTRGPDLGEYGSDAELGGAQATALRKEALADLPRTQRRQLEKEIDRQRVKGMAMRSYLSQEPYSHSENLDVYTVSIVLAQMESRAAVRDLATYQNEFLDALDIFRKGPEVKGHKNAHCFLPPEDDDSDLEAMYCSAYQGDVLVTATADGVKALDTKGVAMLLAEQLDRIAEPGEAV
ncbi:hypothetical protein OG800_27795 [Streptomyces sp. NBC_00445]|uniref:hypothetical protein n=1 Tax=Streptomyces sp. NBC_00445 TaxID=2975745 RepID=UPI002E1C3D64